MAEFDVDLVGAPWIIDQVQAMKDHVAHMSPVAFNEKFRYLPQGVTPRPGYINYALFPFWREIINCFDPRSPVREVDVMKGVQVAFTTALESVLFFYIGHLRTMSAMFLSADAELASGRIENNILPMLNESGFADRIRSSDAGNSRKTGKKKGQLQWDGGGFLIYGGAQNAAKMRQWSVPFLGKDELDGWPRTIGNDGNTDALTDARCSAYWPIRKIFRGSTPLTMPSLINDGFLRGDQRRYMVRCKSCNYPQVLRHRKPDLENGVVRGFQWETENGILVLESVRYCCRNCGHAHFEHDKEYIFAEENGAYWEPTATPSEPEKRSYHLPSWYSPSGFRPWSKGISDLLASYDVVNKQTLDPGRYQEYTNNTLGLPFTPRGSRVHFREASTHRRPEYNFGQVPNAFALQHSTSKILFLTCLVDVHKRDLAVAVLGWTAGARCYVVDYWRFDRRDDDDDCAEISSPVWGRLRELIEQGEYVGDDGTKYGIALTLIDAGYGNDTVTTFCADYDEGVYPILGRDRPSRHQRIKEFDDFQTKAGATGYLIVVDHYKDRNAAALRRNWDPADGVDQPRYHFNAPHDITTKQLTELTVEYRKEETDPKGRTFFTWHRPSTTVANELWDLLGYGHAAVEILAWGICIGHFELEKINWTNFWEFANDVEYADVFCRSA